MMAKWITLTAIETAGVGVHLCVPSCRSDITACGSVLRLWSDFRSALSPFQPRYRVMKFETGYSNGHALSVPGYCECRTDNLFSTRSLLLVSCQVCYKVSDVAGLRAFIQSSRLAISFSCGPDNRPGWRLRSYQYRCTVLCHKSALV